MSGKNKKNLVEGKYSIKDLIDLKKMDKLFKEIGKATNYVTGIISYPDQEILAGTGWNDICENFHRANLSTEKQCVRDNKLLTKELSEKRRYRFRECSQGIIDGAAPVIVRGKHVASLMLGQILFEEPDLKRFERQAEKYGFDKKKYLRALEKLPVVSKEKYIPMLLFLSELATMIAEEGLANLELIVSREELKREIAEKEALFDELKKSEEKFRYLFENSTEAIASVDLKGNFTSANKFMARVMGCGVEEIIGKNYKEFTEPEKGKEIYKAYNSLYRRGGKIKDLTHEVVRKDGTRRFLSGNVNAIREGGKTVGFHCSLRDITDQRLVELELKKTEERFKRIVENAKDVIYRMSLPDGKYEYVSPASKEVIGYTPEEIYENPRLILNSIHPDWVGYFKEQWKDLLKGELLPFYEFQMIHKSGEMKWLNQRNVLIRDEKGNIEAAEAIVTDITASKKAEEYIRESEERYRTLVETTNEGIVVVQDEKFVFFNKVFADMLGYTTDEVMGQPFAGFLHPDHIEKVDDLYRRRMAGEDAPRTYDFAAIKKDGSEMTVEISTALTEWDNKPATISFVRDITEREKDKLLLDAQRTLASTLNATSDLEYAMIVSLSTALKVTGMDSGFIYLVSEDEGLDLIFRDGLPEGLCRHIADLEFDAIGQRLVYKGTPVYMKRDEIAKKIAPSWKKEGLKSLAILPIHHEGELFCYLNVASHELERFTEFSRNALEAIAVEVGGTVSRLMAEKALRDSEERFRNIVESSPMGMLMMQLDPDGRLMITGSNRTADKILNIDTSKFIGMSAEGAFPSLKGTESLEKCRDVAEKGGTWHVERLDYRDKKINGAFEAYAFQSSPKTIAIMFLEISEKVRVEEELKKYWSSLEELIEQRTKELEDAQKELIRKERLAALGRLTASVSHEIRNPLGTVRTSVFSIGDALERNEMDRVERALNLAERNIVRCDAIIAELLDYTRARDLFLKRTDIDEWLMTLLEEQPIPKEIECEWRLNSNVEVSIDREQFRRAVINVINNAVQALEDEDCDVKRITVTTAVSKNRLVLEIADTGGGIPEPIFDKIFEPLFSGKSFGVGMGLPIVKNIMTQHGGDIEIKSEIKSEIRGGTEWDGREGVWGTTVLLWLPLPEKGEK